MIAVWLKFSYGAKVTVLHIVYSLLSKNIRAIQAFALVLHISECKVASCTICSWFYQIWPAHSTGNKWERTLSFLTLVPQVFFPTALEKNWFTRKSQRRANKCICWWFTFSIATNPIHFVLFFSKSAVLRVCMVINQASLLKLFYSYYLHTICCSCIYSTSCTAYLQYLQYSSCIY